MVERRCSLWNGAAGYIFLFTKLRLSTKLGSKRWYSFANGHFVSRTLCAGTGTAWKRSEEIRYTMCGDHYKVWVHLFQLIQLLNLIDGPNWIHILNEERFPNPLPDFARLKRSISYVKHPSLGIEAEKYTYAAGCVAWQ
jgi:hypothetical protein